MNIRELARVSGVSVRTLHLYDRDGLLRPKRDPGNAYRVYTDKDADRLQQILLFRACGFPLKVIRELLDSPGFDREAAFTLQEEALKFEKRRIEGMLNTLEKSMNALKGKGTMSNTEKFEGFDFSTNPYEEEARARWGGETVEKSRMKLDSLGKEGRQEMGEAMNALFAGLAALRKGDPASEEAQAAMAELYGFFNGSFGVHYGPEAFAGLGRMYVEDERFTKNIDRFGEGFSAFLKEAMALYAEKLIQEGAE